MEVAIVYDNTSESGFQSGWGFSCLVNGHVLFDTGEASVSLLYNLEKLNVELADIDSVVISHDHWDHTGGIVALLKKRKGLKVFICPGFSENFKKTVKTLGGELIESSNYQQIENRIWVTGEISGSYKGDYLAEQSLIIKSDTHLHVVTGCSHPGIVKIVEKCKDIFPETSLGTVLGGFHLMDQFPESVLEVIKSLKALGVQKIGPTHCTGETAIPAFKEAFGDDFLSIRAGLKLSLD